MWANLVALLVDQDNRRKLKDKSVLKDAKIFLKDDLTPLRSKLFGYVKSLPNVNKVNTSNGKIHCNTTTGNHVIMKSPFDLSALGISLESIDYERLG